jgi:hypothetical protein
MLNGSLNSSAARVKGLFPTRTPRVTIASPQVPPSRRGDLCLEHFRGNVIEGLFVVFKFFVNC